MKHTFLLLYTWLAIYINERKLEYRIVIVYFLKQFSISIELILRNEGIVSNMEYTLLYFNATILLTKTTAAQNEDALSYYRVRGLYFLAVVFVRSIGIFKLLYFSQK